MKMILFIMSAWLSSAHQPRAAHDKVDLIEVNHYHDETGRHVFDQLIFYDWNEAQHRFNVRAWRLIKDPKHLPRQDHRSNTWRVIWHDAGTLRVVESRSQRETWTQYDPELVNREYLPQERRKELSRAPGAQVRYVTH